MTKKQRPSPIRGKAPPGELLGGSPETHWMLGFGLALAEVNRRRDCPSVIVEIMRDAGVTVAMLKAVGLADYDLRQLRKATKEG